MARAGQKSTVATRRLAVRASLRLGIAWMVLSGAAMAVAHTSKAQTLTGTSGLITIPGGRLHEDGTVVLGGGYLRHEYTRYMDGQFDFTTAYGNLTFLPFLEVGFRLSHAISGNPEALGDRMLLLRARALKEGRYRPSLVVGVHDFIRSSDNSTNNFASLYAVAAKRVRPVAALPAIDVHLGYGSKLLNANHYQFVGLFGGVSIPAVTFGPVLTRSEVLLEYDGEIPNAGIRLELLGHVSVLAALENMDVPVMGGSVHLRL